ncbi:MAG: DNA mismatch repair endonuclease MutL [Candidatus Anstonellales archaeon]
MGKIKIIPKELQEKIAAGEVIERPLNVFKELIENSIDANATRIVVDFNKDFSKIIVRDNGHGMDKEDLKICALPHSTSKISKEEDLYQIQTLGFRGEALASISRVSILTIKSKSQESEDGYFVKLKDGKIIDEGIITMTKGTEVVVENLFYNLPVRKKQIDEIKNEYFNVLKFLETFAVLYYDVKFSVVVDGKILKEYLTINQEERISEIFGINILKNLQKINVVNENYSISGYLSVPGFSVKSSNYQLLFVNNRLVKSYEIESYLKKLYKDMLFLETNPVFILHLKIPFHEVDVNIHPNKKSVKFLKLDKIYELLYNAFNQMISEKKSTKQIGIYSDLNSSGRKGISYLKNADLKVEKTNLTEFVLPNIKDNASVAFTNANQGNENVFSDFRIVGQVNKTYIIIETLEGISFIDQHAAEERIIYDQLINQNMTIKKKNLIMPIALNLSGSQIKILEHYREKFNSIGFEIEKFGENYYLLRAIPEHLEYSNNLISDLLNELIIEEEISDDQFREKIAMKACKSAIKANKELSYKEMKELLDKLFSTSKPFTCPHGRPIIIKFSFGDLEKLFKRKA